MVLSCSVIITGNTETLEISLIIFRSPRESIQDTRDLGMQSNPISIACYPENRNCLQIRFLQTNFQIDELHERLHNAYTISSGTLSRRMDFNRPVDIQSDEERGHFSAAVRKSAPARAFALPFHDVHEVRRPRRYSNVL